VSGEPGPSRRSRRGEPAPASRSCLRSRTAPARPRSTTLASCSRSAIAPDTNASTGLAARRAPGLDDQRKSHSAGSHCILCIGTRARAIEGSSRGVAVAMRHTRERAPPRASWRNRASRWRRASRHDCWSSSTSTASGRSNPCAKTAPLPKSSSPTVHACSSSRLSHKPLRYPVRYDEVQRVDFAGGSNESRGRLDCREEAVYGVAQQVPRRTIGDSPKTHLCATASVPSRRVRLRTSVVTSLWARG
jgi:hypothetical protein